MTAIRNLNQNDEVWSPLLSPLFHSENEMTSFVKTQLKERTHPFPHRALRRCGDPPSSWGSRIPHPLSPSVLPAERQTMASGMGRNLFSSPPYGREGGARYFSSLAKTTPWLTTERKDQPPLAEQNHPLPQSSTLGIFVCGWFRVEGGLVSKKEASPVGSDEISRRFDTTLPEVRKAEMVLAPKMEFFVEKNRLPNCLGDLPSRLRRRRRHLRRALEEPH